MLFTRRENRAKREGVRKEAGRGEYLDLTLAVTGIYVIRRFAICTFAQISVLLGHVYDMREMSSEWV